MEKKALALEAFEVGSKVWVLTIGVPEVNPELDSIRAKRRRALLVELKSKSNCNWHFLCEVR